MVAVAVATVAGNTAVLNALRRMRRAPAHYPLASLAAADLLLGVIVLPVAIARELFVFHLNWIICSLWSTLDVLSCTASILSICLLCWERWGGITAPFAHARRAKRARLYAALVWPVATAVALPTAIVPSHVHYLEGEMPKACTVNNNVSYVFVSIILSFYLPAGVMLALYVRIVQALAAPREMPMRAHRGQRPTVKDTCNSENEIKNEKPSSPLKDKIEKIATFLSPKEKHLDRSGAASNRTEKHLDLPSAASNRSQKHLDPPGAASNRSIKHLDLPSAASNRTQKHLGLPSAASNRSQKHLDPPGAASNRTQKHRDLPGAASNRTQKTREKQTSPDCFQSRQRRATRTIVLLMALFLVCWTPFFIMLPLDSLCECVSDVVRQLCTWLGFMNSALNPLVYAAASPSVRRALRDSFTSRSRITDLGMTPYGRTGVTR